MLGPPGSDVCQQCLERIERVCKLLGVPLPPEKKAGPSPILTFLGIEVDTSMGQLRLPTDKLQRLISMVNLWLPRKSCTRKELESLIGTLQHAGKVIRPGRSFIRRAIALLGVAHKPYHHIRIRSDLAWWKVFATHWNGATLITDPTAPPAVILTSDACGQWGCGAWSGHRWFQLQWVPTILNKQIAVKELIPVIIAAAIWGRHWANKRVRANCDNQAVVSVLNSRYSKEDDLMQLLRCLLFLEAHWQFLLTAVHLPGINNELADDLSRNRVAMFMAWMPSATPYPSYIPPSLLQWLLHSHLEWTSPSAVDIPQLDSAVQFYCRKGIANSTHKTYQPAL